MFNEVNANPKWFLFFKKMDKKCSIFLKEFQFPATLGKGQQSTKISSLLTNIQHFYFHQLKIFSSDLTVRRLFVLQAVMTPIFCHRLWHVFPRIQLKQAILRPLLASGNT